MMYLDELIAKLQEIRNDINANPIVQFLVDIDERADIEDIKYDEENECVCISEFEF